MITVVIPLYNKEVSILNTINSVLNQSFSDFELIVVDDGSVDNSLLNIKSINDQRLKVISQQNSGVSVARNNGIGQAKCNYIALLDADDLWSVSFLEEMSSLIRDFPDASLYGCGYSFQNIDLTLSTPDLGLKSNFRGYLDYFVNAKNNTLFTSSSVVVRKDDFLEIGEFDTRLSRGEDIDMWIRFALNKKTAFYNKPLAVYKLDGENRALKIPVPNDKSLLWNLDRYKQYENTNPVFKEFLDNWRLAHVHNYLTGASTEVTEIKPLLRAVDLKSYSKLWTILSLTPKPFQSVIYRIWISLRSKLKRL